MIDHWWWVRVTDRIDTLAHAYLWVPSWVRRKASWLAWRAEVAANRREAGLGEDTE